MFQLFLREYFMKVAIIIIIFVLVFDKTRKNTETILVFIFLLNVWYHMGPVPFWLI